MRRAAGSSTWSRGPVEELADRHGDVIAVLAALLEGIGRGDFMIAPWKDDGRTACGYCDFKEICPGARAGYAKRKVDDPRRDHLDDVIRSIE